MADWKALVDESNALTKHGGMVLLEGSVWTDPFH